MEPFQQFLTLLGKFLPAAGGVLIADFWLYRWYKGERLRERYQFKPGMKFARINWVGWVAAIVGTILGGWVITWGIPSLNCLWIGVVFYIIIAIACDKAGVKIDLGEHIIDETGA
jgi:purine-cytosine permease-like protein